MMGKLASKPILNAASRCARNTLLFALAVVITLACFLVLPLLGALGHPPDKQLELRSLDVVEEPPPPPPEMEEEEKPPEEKEQPKLETEPSPLDLSELTLALNPGDGGGGAGSFALDLGKYMKAAGRGDDVFSLAELDQKPRVVYQPSPAYPPELRNQRLGGTVVVLFIVSAEGRVENAKAKSSPSPALERQALAAVRKWKFEPGRRAGKPVAFRMQVPITFALN